MGYVENYFSSYPDQTDKIIDLILMVVNIDTPDSNILKRKQSLLRTSLIHVADYEIIDTITNLYVDLVCSMGYQNDKEISHLNTTTDFKNCIYMFLTDLEANMERLEEYLNCRICNLEDDLNSITEGYKIIFQHFARLREDEVADEDSELQSYNACISALTALSKCLFICKDNKEDPDDNKFYKQKNLIFMIKNQNEINFNDVDEPDIDDSTSHLKYKIKLLINEIESVINGIKIKHKEKKIIGKKKQKKANQRQHHEFDVLDKLKKAESSDEVDLIISNEINTYDENMREDRRSINFYFVLCNVYGKKDENLLKEITELMSFFPEFYLPLYFTINKSIFVEFKIPKAYTVYLIKEYSKIEEERAVHDYMKQSIENKLFSENKFLVFYELSLNLFESNIVYSPYILNKLGITDFDEGMLYLGMFIKKIFIIMKYIEVYSDIQMFLLTSFSTISIREIFEKINSSPKNLMTIVQDLIDSIPEIYEASETSNENNEKIKNLQSELMKQSDF